MRILNICLCILLLANLSGSLGASEPLSVPESLKRLRLHPELKIECVAAEPLVIDPVAIRFDAQGRMWVVEMRDYPHGPADGKSGQSQVKILTDEDGDGRFDRSVIFADQLLFATGVLPWKNGALVTYAGAVDFMQDTDGDGRADRRETWFRGFAQQNPQLRANHPRLNIDGLVYVANGLRGGEVMDARRADAKKVPISGMDFRFDPHTGQYSAASGVGQFGMTVDDFGNRFVCTNRNPFKHIVLENDQVTRYDLAAVESVVHDVAAAGVESRVFPISRAWTTSNLHAGQFTAACGLNLYLGDGLSDEFTGDAFTCDPTGNLVHRERLKRHGATFRGRRARRRVEFLASDDEWFRPVNLETGPDGALYVVDMYRAVIEHPQFMPQELKQRPDLRLGDDRGRIYRVFHQRDKPKTTFTSDASLKQLVQALEDANGWTRATAFQLLLERLPETDAPALRQLARTTKSAAGCSRALWLLHLAKALDPDTVKYALAHQSPDVRQQAVRLAEYYVAADSKLHKAWLQRAGDPGQAVRFQLALAISGQDDAIRIPALQRIATRGDSDVWLHRAIRIGAKEAADQLLLRLLANEGNPQRWLSSENAVKLVADLIASTVRSADATKLAQVSQQLIASEDLKQRDKTALLADLLVAAARRRITVAQFSEQPDVVQQIEQQFFAPARQALQQQRIDERTADSVLRLLSVDLASTAILAEFAISDARPAWRASALQTLAARKDFDGWPKLLESYPAESPVMRRAILDAHLRNANRTIALLDAFEAGTLRTTELDRTRANRLLKHRDATIRNRATKLIAAATQDRQQVLKQYSPVVARGGNAQKGREVFAKQCATCHRIGDVGVNVGPDISDSRVKTAQQLLNDVLIPNQAIDNNYLSYSVSLDDGQLLSGILAAETANSVTIREPENKTTTIPRSQIDEIRSNGISLMPDGVEKNITAEQMADLIAFIKNWRYMDGKTPLGKE